MNYGVIFKLIPTNVQPFTLQSHPYTLEVFILLCGGQFPIHSAVGDDGPKEGARYVIQAGKIIIRRMSDM